MAFKAFVVLMALCLVSLASGFVAPTSMARNGEWACVFGKNHVMIALALSFFYCLGFSPLPQHPHARKLEPCLMCVISSGRREPPGSVSVGQFAVHA